jgi:hypothetical protein
MLRNEFIQETVIKAMPKRIRKPRSARTKRKDSERVLLMRKQKELLKTVSVTSVIQ